MKTINVNITFKNCLNKNEVGNFDVIAAKNVDRKEENDLMWDGFEYLGWNEPERDIEMMAAKEAGIPEGEFYYIRFNA